MSKKDDELALKITCNKTKKEELQKKLNDGKINYEGEICKSIFVSHVSSHKDILETWIDSYEEGKTKSKKIKNHLKTLKNATDSASTADYIFGVVDEESWATAIF